MGEARKIIDWRGQDDAAEVEAINEGIDAADRGELTDYEDVRAELDEMIRRL